MISFVVIPRLGRNSNTRAIDGAGWRKMSKETLCERVGVKGKCESELSGKVKENCDLEKISDHVEATK